MSDHNENDNLPEEVEIKGGWQKPSATGGWKPVTPKPKKEESTGWRVVQAMPSDLSTEPSDEGVWHLPKPEHTTFTPEDEISISEERPETGTIFPRAFIPDVPGEDDEAIADTLTDEDEDDDTPDAESTGAIGGLSDLIALVSLVDEQAEPSIVLTEDSSEDDEALADEDEDEEDLSFGGAPSEESEALSRLSEAETDTTEADTEALADQLSYAQQQLAELASEEAATAEEDAPLSDAAAYAREQLAAIGDTSADTPIEDVAAVDAEQDALALQFAQTENQVRELRQQYHSGQMTRDELQTKLRDLLILDGDTWWMMGVDTDTWYRYDNTVNDWVQDEPPRRNRQGVPTMTGTMDPVDVLHGSLPYLPDDAPTSPTEYTQYSTSVSGDFGSSLEDMPLPTPVPIDDPNRTMVGPSANLEPWRKTDAPTLEGSQVYAGETLPGQTMRVDDYTVVSSPAVMEPETPPDYDLGPESPAYAEAVDRERQSVLRRVLTITAILTGLLFIIGAVAVFGIVIAYNNIANEYREQVIALANYEPEFQTATILDAHGNVLAELTSERGGARRTVRLDEISDNMIYAVVAVEDERFFENPGYDPLSIVRAFWENYTAGTVVSGASTITQQIASALIIQDSTPTADNKLREIIVAAEIGQRYSKSEILELYLNEIFLGNQSYGVEEAARFYFDKSARDLDLAEAAMIAGLIASPNANNPVTSPQNAFTVMDNSLKQIASVGCLNFHHGPNAPREVCVPRNAILNAQGEFAGQILVQRAQVQIRNYIPREMNVKYPHFIQFVLARLEREFGPDEIYRRGFTVRTTLLPEIQDTAEQALQERLRLISFSAANTGAVLAADPRDGAIRAMVGSPNFNDEAIGGQVNNTLSWQQPGSAIKPILYAGALEGFDRNGNGSIEPGEYLTAASVLWDVPTTFATTPPYTPQNFFAGQYQGPVPVRTALASSYNVPAVKVLDMMGPNKFIDIAQRLGLTFVSDPPNITLASALGATDVRLFDMVQAYSTIANNGEYMPLYAIIEITDSDNNPVPMSGRPPSETRLRADIAFLLQNILSDDVARGPGFGRNSELVVSGYENLVGAKTGTTNDARDLWTMGFSRNAVVGVWIGRHDNAPTNGVGTQDSATPIWNITMRAMLQNESGRPAAFAAPNSNVVQGVVCTLTGTLDDGNCPGGGRRNEYWVADRPPLAASQGLVQQVEIDSWTGLRANQFCQDNIEVRTFATINDGAAVAWLNDNATGRQIASALGLPTPVQLAPQQSCDVNTLLPSARIMAPMENNNVSNMVQVNGAVSAQNFNRYQLEVAPEGSNNYTIVAGPFTQAQPAAGGALGEWDSTRFNNGPHILRLSVYANDGGYLYRTVRVNIDNIPPTPTPTQTPPPSAPPMIQITATTIPFNESQFQSGGGPVVTTAPQNNFDSFSSESTGAGTPTATINPGG
jgi:membrane peptidoglycan carboxypeptidase